MYGLQKLLFLEPVQESANIASTDLNKLIIFITLQDRLLTVCNYALYLVSQHLTQLEAAIKTQAT